MNDVAQIAKDGAGIFRFADPREAVAGVDAVYTDVWASMGEEGEADERRQIFAPYQINADLMAGASLARSSCIACPRTVEKSDLGSHRLSSLSRLRSSRESSPYAEGVVVSVARMSAARIPRIEFPREALAGATTATSLTRWFRIPDLTLVDYLSKLGREHADKTALLFKGSTVSYGQLEAEHCVFRSAGTSVFAKAIAWRYCCPTARSSWSRSSAPGRSVRSW